MKTFKWKKEKENKPKLRWKKTKNNIETVDKKYVIILWPSSFHRNLGLLPHEVVLLFEYDQNTGFYHEMYVFESIRRAKEFARHWQEMHNL